MPVQTTLSRGQAQAPGKHGAACVKAGGRALGAEARAGHLGLVRGVWSGYVHVYLQTHIHMYIYTYYEHIIFDVRIYTLYMYIYICICFIYIYREI